MKIQRNMTVGQLKKSFFDIYPNLVLRVYSRMQEEDLAVVHEVEHIVLLADLNTKLRSGVISIVDDLKVSDLVGVFQNRFGLRVKIFKDSVNLMLPEETNREWTLKMHDSNKWKES